jgi:hypothetical protein
MNESSKIDLKTTLGLYSVKIGKDLAKTNRL